MNIRWLPITALAVAYQIASAEEAPATGQQSMPELSVQSQRERLHALKAELVQLEDQFFSEYNKVNDVWYYDVKCGWEQVSGHSLHLCRPVFQEWAERQSALAWSDPGVGAAAANDVRIRTSAYQKHMVDVVGKNPELLRVLQQRDETRKNYDTLYTQMHKGKFWVWD